MKKYIYSLLLLVMFSCSKKEDTSVSTSITTSLTTEEIKVISQSAIEIQEIIAEIASTTNDLSKISGVLEKKLPDLKKLQMVETINLSSTSCFVKFLKGGYVVFNFDAVYSKGQRKSYDTDAMKRQLKNLKAKILEPNNKLAGKKSICIIHSNSDESSEIDNEIKERLIDFNNELKDLGFNSDYVPQQLLTPDFIENNLNKYDLIWWYGHGTFDDKSGLTTLYTGYGIVREEYDNWIEKNQYSWQSLESVIYANYTGDGKKNISNGITNRFIAEKFKTKKFPNSLVILTACQGLKDPNEKMAKAFLDNGASTILGWTESVPKRPAADIASILVFSLMAPKPIAGVECFSVSQIYPSLVNEINDIPSPPEEDFYKNLRGLLKVQSRDNMKFTLCN